MAARSPSERGLVATLLGLGVLVVVGFSVGLLAGVLWEEPGLVVAYLGGDTEEVQWTTATAEVTAEGLPPVAAAPESKPAAPPEPKPKVLPPRPKPKREAQARKEPAAQKRPAPAPAVAAAPSGRVAIQVGAFGDSDSAESLAEKLRGRGYPVYVAPGSGSTARWRVRVGPLGTRTEADALAARLKRDEKLPTWVLEEGGG